jgi:uncharacterized protein YfdQ (DUF2303 family)
MGLPQESVTAISDLTRAGILHSPTDTVPFATVPQGYKLESLEHLMVAPSRVKQSLRLKTADAFIAYVDRFQVRATTIYADVDSLRFKAVLDHHSPDDGPAWGDHVALYNCPLSREWKAWTESDDTKMDQVDFASFLEDRIKDIVHPSGAELLEIATKFQVIRKAVFGSAKNLSTGEFQLQYSEENDKGTVEVPAEITLGIAPFHNGDAYGVKAKLRYRLRDGQLVLWYQLVDPQKVIEDAFSEVMVKVDSALDVQMLEAEA